MLEITKDNFEKEVKGSEIPVLVDFWAEWCPPCKMLGPVFEELSGEYADKLKFVKVNVEENQELAGKYEVRGIPCLILMKKGEEVDRIVGFLPKEQLKAKIDEIMG